MQQMIHVIKTTQTENIIQLIIDPNMKRVIFSPRDTKADVFSIYMYLKKLHSQLDESRTSNGIGHLE